ncbi:rod shape-determining protein MreC [Albimonas donghaensis]|uniref:Cell shape-determining protein MreC n=1 Tax=Albimonas donghaensis TaxID=356660 RepID=A0A1H2RJ80_9RHOB|nr:rod shape-determining protein MreC [Albimonas donghaensis]SDW19220.1 rod shape-determining protein MreC [Albimonas donghaensis]
MARDDGIAEGGAARALRRILLLVLCLFLLAVFAFWRLDNPRVDRIRMSVVDGLQPVIERVGGPLDFLSAMVADFENFVRVYEQNEALRLEIQRLRAWRESALALEQENARLRALNNVRLSPSLGFVTGEVIGDSGGPFLATGLINVGRRDGVMDGAAVMDGAGLAGRVVGLGRRAARILYLTDYSSRIPVLIRPSGRRAILSGDGGPAPRLDFLEDPDEVRPGDRVVTSGDGEVFPPELSIGLVIAGPDGSPRTRLAADLERLEFVRVLRYRPDTSIDQPGGLIHRGGPLDETGPESGPDAAPDGGGAPGPDARPGPEARPEARPAPPPGAATIPFLTPSLTPGFSAPAPGAGAGAAPGTRP